MNASTPSKVIKFPRPGKFFSEFMRIHLPWETKGETRTDTFRELEVGRGGLGMEHNRYVCQAGLRNEFTLCQVVDCVKVMEGHEDEVVKVRTLVITCYPALSRY